VEIRGIAREAGYRIKIAVFSDNRLDRPHVGMRIAVKKSVN
jgi:transcription antitermination factor NusA-like protein